VSAFLRTTVSISAEK